MNITLTPEAMAIIEAEQRTVRLLTEAGFPTDTRKRREVIGALMTGCLPNKEKKGADCYMVVEGKKLPCERKSNAGFKSGGELKNPSGAFTGLSLQGTKLEQRKYMIRKVGEMHRVWFDNFDPNTGALSQVWWMTGEKALEILWPIVERKWDNLTEIKNKGGKLPKDPRLDANISWTKIQKHGHNFELPVI
jgi:hypothetical protein